MHSLLLSSSPGIGKLLTSPLPCSFSAKGHSSFFLYFPKKDPSLKLRTSVTASAFFSNSKDKKANSHMFNAKPDEAIDPEAVLLREKKVEEVGGLLPEFADAEEEGLLEGLNLQLESDLGVDQMRHYEVVYMIHEDRADEVESVNTKVQDFLKEKKGKIWRFNDWGMRRLQYKIQKAWRAHYILMNFEMEAKWINDFKSMLDKDERVIRHLVIKQDKAETEDCPPPPDFDSLRAGTDENEEDMDDFFDDDDDYDDDENEDDYEDDEEGEDDYEDDEEGEDEYDDDEEGEDEYDDNDEDDEEGEDEDDIDTEMYDDDDDNDGVIVVDADDDEDGKDSRNSRRSDTRKKGKRKVSEKIST